MKREKNHIIHNKLTDDTREQEHIQLQMDSMKDKIDPCDIINPILASILSRTGTYEQNLTEEAISYGEKYFQQPNNASPIQFVMFNKPPNDGLHTLWSYQKILSTVDTVVNELPNSDAKSIMSRDIGHLIYGTGPMTDKHLKIVSGSRPNWNPIGQTLAKLKKEVKVMDGKPKAKHDPDPNIDLEIVVWMLLRDLATLMKDINTLVASNTEIDPEEQ